jgi:hypothetical protein
MKKLKNRLSSKSPDKKEQKTYNINNDDTVDLTNKD